MVKYEIVNDDRVSIASSTPSKAGALRMAQAIAVNDPSQAVTVLRDDGRGSITKIATFQQPPASPDPRQERTRQAEARLTADLGVRQEERERFDRMAARAERSPDLADVMAAAEAVTRDWIAYGADYRLAPALRVLAGKVQSARSAQGLPYIQQPEPAYQPCPGPGPEGEPW